MKMVCKNCGRPLVLVEGVNSCECEYCGTLHTIPSFNDEQKRNSYDRAELLQQQCNFIDAKAILNDIAINYPPDYAVFWNLAMCTYGIEYVEDRKTGKRIPTCHRTLIKSIFDNEDFKKAYELADVVTKDKLMHEAEKIDAIQKEILKIAANDKPYDVFICYKETDDGSGRRTYDSSDAQDVYTQLTKDGYNVFFARVSLSEYTGEEYEPHIYAALNSAKVMVLISSRDEYIDAPWVKNEWSRFIEMAERDKSKLIIPCYKNTMLPKFTEIFGKIQALNIGSVTFYTDLLAKVQKLCKKRGATNSAAVSGVENLLERAKMFIDDKDFESAKKYCEQILDIDAKNAKAYFYKMLAFLGMTEDMLSRYEKPIENDGNFQKALRFADDEYRAVLQGYNERVRENCRLRQEKTDEANRIKKEEDLNNTLAKAKKALNDGEFSTAKNCYDILASERPSATIYFSLLLSMRQCRTVKDLVSQGIPINAEERFKKAYELADTSYKAFLTETCEKVLYVCQHKFMNYAMKKDTFYMEQWAKHYEKFGDSELAKTQRFIIKNGGLDNKTVFVPGAFLKLAEIYERLGKEKLTDNYKDSMQTALFDFSKNMENIEELIMDKRVFYVSKDHKENVEAAAYLGYLNKTVKKAFNVSDKAIENGKINKAAWEKDQQTKEQEPNMPHFANGMPHFAKLFANSQKELAEKGITIKSLSEINEEANYAAKGETVASGRRKAAIMEAQSVKASVEALTGLIDIWADPKGSFVKSSGINIGEISFNDEYSDIPEKRYMSIGKRMLKFGLSDENQQIAKICFDRAEKIGGKKYSKEADKVKESVINRNSTDTYKIKEYLKLKPNDAELNWQYIVAFTRDFTRDVSTTIDTEKTYEGYNKYMSATKSRSADSDDRQFLSVKKELEDGIASIENYITNAEEVLAPYLKAAIDGAGEEKVRYQKTWNAYVTMLRDRRDTVTAVIRSKIATATEKHNNTQKTHQNKETAKKTTIITISVIVALLSLIPALIMQKYNANPTSLLGKYNVIWFGIVLCIITVIVAVGQGVFQKNLWKEWTYMLWSDEDKGFKGTFIPGVLFSIFSFGFIIYSLVTFNAKVGVVSITTAEQFKYINNFPYADYKLDADIDMSTHQGMTIAKVGKSLDGQGHIIKNLKTTQNAFIKKNTGTITNVVFEDLTLALPIVKTNKGNIVQITLNNPTAELHITEIFGFICEENTKSGVIENCLINNAILKGKYENINNEDWQKNLNNFSNNVDCRYFGGISGKNKGLITKSNINGITGEKITVWNFGGISADGGTEKLVGAINECNVTNISLKEFYCRDAFGGIASSGYTNYLGCTTGGNINIYGKKETSVGGISGELGNGNSIKYCINNINIYTTSSNISIGGIVGKLTEDTLVETSQNNGSIIDVINTAEEDDGAYIGGIVGLITAKNCLIKNVVNAGNLKFDTSQYKYEGDFDHKGISFHVAGLCGGVDWRTTDGYENRVIESSYSSGSVTSVGKEVSRIAGLQGYRASLSNVQIKNSFFAGKFVVVDLGYGNRGWIIGQSNDNNYYSTDSGYNDKYSGYFDEAEEISPQKLRDANFIKNTLGWDESVWNIENGKLPTLKPYVSQNKQ